MLIFLCIVFLIAGGIMAYILLKRNTEIRFKVSIFDWMMPVMSIFIFISLTIIFETIFNDWIQRFFQSPNLVVCIIGRLIEGGILIPFMAFGLSRLFGRLSISCDLDLNPLYGEFTAKIFFTFTILVNSIGFFVYMANNFIVESDECRSLVTRLVIWVISAISIWLPIGNGCEGRIRENRINEKLSKKKIDVRTEIKYYLPICLNLFGISTLFFIEFMEIQFIKKYLGMARMFIYMWAGGCFVIILLLVLLENPSKKISDRRLAKRIRLASSTEYTTYYRNVKYSIMRIDSQIKVCVSKRTVIYESNQEETDRVFRDRQESFEINDAYAKIRKYLSDIVEERNKYLNYGFVQCRESLQQKLEEEYR